MEYVDCVLVGGDGVGKHSLLQSFTKAENLEDEVSLSLTLEKHKVDFVVHVMDESVDIKFRRLSYVKADVVIMAYSTVDLVTYNLVKKTWREEVRDFAPHVPVLLIGTKIDRVPEALRDRVRLRGDKTAKELGCIGFQESSILLDSNNKVATALFERAVQSGLAKKKLQQRAYEQDVPKKGLKFFRKTQPTSLPDVLKNEDIQNVSRIATISATTNDYTYTWHGELVCALIEDCQEGSYSYSHSDTTREMRDTLCLEAYATAAATIAKKFALFFHFLPVIQQALDHHNLEFWLDVEDFKFNLELRKRNKRMKKEAARIYHEFIEVGAAREVNIQSEVQTDITKRAMVVSNNRVFDLAQVHVLNQLTALFRERFAGSHTAMELLKAFSESELVSTSVTDAEVSSGFPRPTGEGIGLMVRRCVHVMTLIEFLQSSNSSDKRPTVIQFMKQEEPKGIAQYAIKFLILFNALNRHIDHEKSQENLMFWLDVEDFRSLEFVPTHDSTPETHEQTVMSQVLARARHILDRYIDDSAQWLVNLPSNLTKQIKSSVAELEAQQMSGKHDAALKSLKIFDAAQREILLLMKRDSWRRFSTESGAESSWKQAKQLVSRLYQHDEFDDPDKKMAEARFQARFDLMEDETLIREFKTALDRKMLVIGTIQLTKRHLCFFSNIMGFKTKICYPYSDIIDIHVQHSTNGIPATTTTKKTRDSRASRDNEALVITTADGQTMTFRNTVPDTSQFLYVLNKARKRGGGGGAPVVSPTETLRADDDDDDEVEEKMEEKHWEMLKEGAKVSEFKKGDKIFEEGTHANSIFQIARGSCRIEKATTTGEPIILRTCEEGEIIGEISFIEGGLTSASVVAESSDVVVYAISREFLEGAFVSHPDLPRRFYKFLALLLAGRLRTKKTVEHAPNPGLHLDLSSDTAFRDRFDLQNESASVLLSVAAAMQTTDTITLYGQLYLSQTCVAFYAKVLGSEKRELVPLPDISHMNANNKTRSLIISRRAMDSHFTLLVDDPEMVRTRITEQQALNTHDSPTIRKIVLSMGDVDWSKFLRGAELKEYGSGDVIMTEGKVSNYVYQFARGGAQVQKHVSGQPVTVYRNLEAGELFGEMSFLQGGAASASIVATTNGTYVYLIEKQFVDSLLGLDTHLPGRFYKFLASSLAGRLRN